MRTEEIRDVFDETEQILKGFLPEDKIEVQEIGLCGSRQCGANCAECEEAAYNAI